MFSWMTLLSLLPVIIAILFSGYITYRYNLVLNETRDIVRHSLSVSTAINDIMLDLQDLETGQRGYVITGDADYLEPFDTARETFQGDLEKLRSLVRDNPAQIARTDRVANLAGQKLDELERTIRVRRDQGFAAAQAIVADDVGKTTMDEIRDEVDAMHSDETDLLNENTERLKQTERQVVFVIAITMALALIGRLVGIVLPFLWRRRKASKATSASSAPS